MYLRCSCGEQPTALLLQRLVKKLGSCSEEGGWAEEPPSVRRREARDGQACRRGIRRRGEASWPVRLCRLCKRRRRGSSGRQQKESRAVGHLDAGRHHLGVLDEVAAAHESGRHNAGTSLARPPFRRPAPLFAPLPREESSKFKAGTAYKCAGPLHQTCHAGKQAL
jgi:hypothetical protein